MSTTRNAAYVLSAQAMLLFSGLLISIGLGRFLGPELYGRYGVVLAVATVLNILLTPGMMQAAAKFTAERKDKAGAIATALLKSQAVAGLAIAAAYFALAFPLANALKDKALLQLLWILTPLALFYGITAVYSGYLTGTGRFKEQSIQLIIYSISRLALTLGLAYAFSITGAVVAMPLASLIVLIYTARIANVKAEKGYPSKGIYRLSARLAAFSALVALFTNTDLLLVQALLNNGQLTGYYTAAGTAARVPYFMLTALGTLILPKMAEKLTNPGQQARIFMKESLRYILMLLIPGTAIMAATAKPLVMLLYKSNYAAAAQPAAIMAIGMAALTIAYLLATSLNAAGKIRLTLTLTGAMLLASTAANIYAIPRYGLTGAAVAVSAAAIAAAIAFAIAAHKNFGQIVSYGSMAKVTLATAAILTIALMMPTGNKFLLPLEYAIIGIAYLTLLFAMKEIKKEDVERVKGLMPAVFLTHN